MARQEASSIKVGNKVLVDAAPYMVVANEGVNPGKGQAFNRMRLKNLLTQRVVERTYKAAEQLELADIEEHSLVYLYHDAEAWVFMNPESYEQVSVPDTLMEDVKRWIKEQDVCSIMLWNDQPISVLPPTFVVRLVTECAPGVRGDTVTKAMKQAVIETGAMVMVPLFLEQGELIRVDTRTGDYVNRVKDEG